MIVALAPQVEERLGKGNRPKAFRAGTHRTDRPELTLDRIRPHFDAFGITRIADVTGLDQIGIPVAQAIRPMAKSVSVYQGKGLTREFARVSAAMKAIEYWHAENLRLPFVVGRPEKLGRSQLLLATTRCDPATGLPCNLDNVPMRVVEGFNLISGGPVFVPVDQVTMDFTLEPDQSVVVQSSNGLASGNTLAEAVASGLFEVIGRDCLADFDGLSPGAKANRRVSLGWCRNAGAGHALSAIRAGGLRLTVWDITNDIRVPAFLAILKHPEQAAGKPGVLSFVGSGCHLDPVVALQRAVLNAIQSRATAIGREGRRADRQSQSDAYSGLAQLCFKAPALRPHLKDLSAECSLGDVMQLVRRLKNSRCGDIAIVDLSRSGVGVNVVRVVAPDLGSVRPGQRHGRGTRHTVR